MVYLFRWLMPGGFRWKSFETFRKHYYPFCNGTNFHKYIYVNGSFYPTPTEHLRNEGGLCSRGFLFIVFVSGMHGRKSQKFRPDRHPRDVLAWGRLLACCPQQENEGIGLDNPGAPLTYLHGGKRT